MIKNNYNKLGIYEKAFIDDMIAENIGPYDNEYKQMLNERVVNKKEIDDYVFRKEKSIADYYVLCFKLKNIVRTGWLNWKVDRERIESVAEHIFSMQMLAISMYFTYKENYKDIDLEKVLFLIAIHELGEIKIGDLTQFQISKDDKIKIEHAAVHEVLSSLLDSDTIEELYLEFDDKKTKEAFYAYQCDKLDCDIQSKIYDEEGCVDLTKQEGNKTMKNPLVKELLDKGATWSEMWMQFGRTKYPYDDNFKAVSMYVENHDITGKNLGKELKLKQDKNKRTL